MDKVKECEGDYRLFIDDSDSLIVVLHLTYSKVLKIDKKTGEITEDDQSIISNLNISNVYKPHAILGIITINKLSYLLYVDKYEIVGSINSSDIFKVIKTNFIPLFNKDYTRSGTTNDIEIQNLKNLLSLGFYYSFKYDLSTSRQKKQQNLSININNSNSIKDISNENCMENIVTKYFWNLSLNKKLFEAKVNKVWSIVCIFGYVNIQKLVLSGETVQLSIISRRSCNNPGIYNYAKGISDSGHVANYVETEIIISIKQKIYSFVILRGSAPVFFDEDLSNSQILIKKNANLTSQAFIKHLQEIQQNFKFIMMMNLMNEKNLEEDCISTSFKTQFEINEINNCKYHQFDLYNNCSNDNFAKLDKYIHDNLLKILVNFNCYREESKDCKDSKYSKDCQDSKDCKDSKDSKEINKEIKEILVGKDSNSSEDTKNEKNKKESHTYEQKGVFRVNCLDSLDRTNIFQSRICWQILLIIVSISF